MINNSKRVKNEGTTGRETHHSKKLPAQYQRGPSSLSTAPTASQTANRLHDISTFLPNKHGPTTQKRHARFYSKNPARNALESNPHCSASRERAQKETHSKEPRRHGSHERPPACQIPDMYGVGIELRVDNLVPWLGGGEFNWPAAVPLQLK
jgi:hypothetical protein